MTTDTVAIVIIQIILGILLIAECYLYFGKKGEAGEVIKNISVPLKYNVIKVAVYAAIFLVWFYVRVLLIQGDYTKMDLIYAAVLLGELIIAIILDNLPQQICENGVVTHRGFMAWTKIQSVEECEKSEAVQLKVKEKAGFMQQIFCVEAEKKAIEEYVAEHMNYISEMTETMEPAKNTETEETVESAPVEEAEVSQETVTEEELQETKDAAEFTEESVQEAVTETETTEEISQEDEKEIVVESDKKVIDSDVPEEEIAYDEISEWLDESEIEESLDKKTE